VGLPQSVATALASPRTNRVREVGFDVQGPKRTDLQGPLLLHNPVALLPTAAFPPLLLGERGRNCGSHRHV